MTPTDGERYLTKSIMRNIESTTGFAPRNRSIWPAVLSYVLWAMVIAAILTLSIYNGE